MPSSRSDDALETCIDYESIIARNGISLVFARLPTSLFVALIADERSVEGVSVRRAMVMAVVSVVPSPAAHSFWLPDRIFLNFDHVQISSRCESSEEERT